MLTFGIKIIISLIIIGGATAITGNYIGKAIGRRHWTIFHLRPRHTANIVTVITGILIACFTMATMLIISQDARTALFGLDKLKQDAAEKSHLLISMTQDLEQMTTQKAQLDTALTGLNTKLTAAKQEIAALAKAKAKLSREVSASRQGQVLFKINDLILTSLIKAGPDKSKIEAGLDEILAAAETYVRSLGGSKTGRTIYLPAEIFNRTTDELQQLQGEIVVAVKVTRNTLFGEEVPIAFNLAENKLIYSPGQKISELQIDSTLSQPEIEQAIKKLLAMTHLAAKKDGVMPDASGSVGKVTYEQIFSLAKKIKTANKSVWLQSVAKSATYTIGPLEVDFKILYRQTSARGSE